MTGESGRVAWQHPIRRLMTVSGPLGVSAWTAWPLGRLAAWRRGTKLGFGVFNLNAGSVLRRSVKYCVVHYCKS